MLKFALSTLHTSKISLVIPASHEHSRKRFTCFSAAVDAGRPGQRLISIPRTAEWLRQGGGVILADDPVAGEPVSASVRRRAPAGSRGGRNWRWTRNRGSFCARSRCGPDRHRLLAHAGGAHFANPSRRARKRARRRDAIDECVHRATGARTSQPVGGRGGPICLEAQPFPLAAGAVAPLREAAEKRGSGDFSPLWAGEAAALAREKSTETLTHSLWTDALAVMRNLNQ